MIWRAFRTTTKQSTAHAFDKRIDGFYLTRHLSLCGRVDIGLCFGPSVVKCGYCKNIIKNRKIKKLSWHGRQKEKAGK